MTQLRLEDFWYVVAESHELRPGAVLARKVLGQALVCFRDAHGVPRAFEDRCLHRNAPLSAGRVSEGRLVCGYHGWCYDGDGRVAAISSLGPQPKYLGERRVRSFAVREQERYVYVRLASAPAQELAPFRIPHHGERGFRTLRLQNRFANSVTNCVENFVDVPHTAFVHEGIFRSTRRERVTARVVRQSGAVHVEYRDERRNLGSFRWFLNPSGAPIVHRDHFYMPNVTWVEYDMGPRRRFYITSQSVPIEDAETLVYTDLSWDYGVWTRPSTPFVRRHAQRIIDQDIAILARQMEVIRAHGGPRFAHSPADLIHVFIESIRTALAEGKDARLLPERSEEIELWI